MALEIEKQINTPNAELISFLERIEKIVNNEWDLRYNKKTWSTR